MLCDKPRKTTLLQFESLEQVRQSVLSRIKQTVKDADVKKSVMDAVVSAKKDAKKELDKWDSKVSCLGRKKKKNQKKDSKKKKLKKEAKKKKQAAKKKKIKKRRRESTSSSSSSSSSDDNDEEDESDDKKDDDMEEDNESSDDPGSDDEKCSSKAKSSKSKGLAQQDRKDFWNKYQKAKTGEKPEEKSAPSVAPSSEGRVSGQVDDDLWHNPRFSPQPSIPELQEDLKELLNAVENKYIAMDSVTWLNLKWEMAGSVSSFFAMAIGNPLFDGWKNGLCESLGVCWCEAGWAEIMR